MISHPLTEIMTTAWIVSIRKRQHRDLMNMAGPIGGNQPLQPSVPAFRSGPVPRPACHPRIDTAGRREAHVAPRFSRSSIACSPCSQDARSAPPNGRPAHLHPAQPDRRGGEFRQPRHWRHLAMTPPCQHKSPERSWPRCGAPNVKQQTGWSRPHEAKPSISIGASSAPPPWRNVTGLHVVISGKEEPRVQCREIATNEGIEVCSAARSPQKLCREMLELQRAV